MKSIVGLKSIIDFSFNVFKHRIAVNTKPTQRTSIGQLEKKRKYQCCFHRENFINVTENPNKIPEICVYIYVLY